MTPLEEAIARINDPEAFRFPNSDRWEVERHLAHLKARAILALPAIVKMQGALERCADIVEHNLYHQREKVEGVVQIARAALQPLKKEAE